MNVHATPGLSISGSEWSLANVLEALAPHEAKSLVIQYGGQRIQPGYHVTEVKAASFVTLDCGGNPDAWQETILQVEDIPARDEGTYMTVGRFCSILAQVDRKVRLNAGARLTFEIGRPDEPMRIFDVAELQIDQSLAVLTLGPRPAICKPRHRAEQAAAACCSPASKSSCC